MRRGLSRVPVGQMATKSLRTVVLCGCRGLGVARRGIVWSSDLSDVPNLTFYKLLWRMNSVSCNV